MELSKNVVRGLAAYRELLSTRPEWHRRVTHLAFAYPSRSGLALHAGLCMPAAAAACEPRQWLAEQFAALR